jgi:hypothetical protein
VHPPETRAEVLRLIAAGLKDGAVSRELGVPRSTVRDMRKAPPKATCPRCWQTIRESGFTAGRYAELLGFYLGDGHISTLARTQRLRISLDARHSQIVDDVCRLLAACFPGNRVGVVIADGGATAVPYVYSSHLGCFFPQQGRGAKHLRSIVLEPWQEEAVRAAPFAFLRGLIHSDGCFFINRTGPYRYLSAEFSNQSPDIRALFCRACDLAGVEYRVNGKSVRIYRRESVRRLALFVGAKW